MQQTFRTVVLYVCIIKHEHPFVNTYVRKICSKIADKNVPDKNPERFHRPHSAPFISCPPSWVRLYLI